MRGVAEGALLNLWGTLGEIYELGSSIQRSFSYFRVSVWQKLSFVAAPVSRPAMRRIFAIQFRIRAP